MRISDTGKNPDKLLAPAGASASNRERVAKPTPPASIPKTEWETDEGSPLERSFITRWRRLHGSQAYVRNLRFDLPDSKMELDFSWPDLRIAIEINGGQGRGNESGHSNWAGLARDARKQNACVLKGWTLFWLTTSMVRDDAFITPIVAFIDQKEKESSGNRRRGDQSLQVPSQT